MLDKIKAEIQKVIDAERNFTSESAKAQALALFWVLELIDKYAEQEPCRVKNELKVELNELEPCDDVVSRDMALEKMADYVASGYADSVEDFEEYSRIICQLPTVRPQEPILEHWQELKETIIEMRDNDGTGTQQEVCKFLANYMGVLEKQFEPQESEE